MNNNVENIQEYLEGLSDERKFAVNKIREVLKENLPDGFHEELSYNMIGYVIPHSIYEKGYHVNPDLPLPFINLASQKNYIALYHSGMYMNAELLKWFEEEYKKRVVTKLDMGKSCIRFKDIDNIPYDLIKELALKMTPAEFISAYEKTIK
ncbi:MAG: DUF1801 domain-containing protein [Gudongella sp.]|jgi:uncharacterized protein YdhG (YjbR/CyaY superfamily)|nr:DUF1801 domain-containing protein [Gudongella sp.]